MEQDFLSLQDVVAKLQANKKRILYYTVAAFVLSALISLLIPNQYTATTIFYPANDMLMNPDVLFGQNQEVEYYGGSAERDRLLSVAHSDALFDSLNNETNLYAHYGIDSSKANSRFQLKKKFDKYFHISKNELDALEMSFTDTDPIFAAKIANESRNYLNSSTTSIIKKNQKGLVEVLDTKIKSANVEMKILMDSIRMLQQTNQIYDAEEMYQMLSSQLLSAKKKLAEDSVRLTYYIKTPRTPRDTITKIRASIVASHESIKKISGKSEVSDGLNLNRLMKIKPKMDDLQMLYNYLKGQMGSDENQKFRMENALAADIPALHVVEPAAVPLIKSAPKRSLIVLMSTAFAFFFICIGILIQLSYQQFNSKNA